MARRGKQMGPAARIGDLVQITHVTIEKDAIILQINNGLKCQGRWKDHVSVGMGGGHEPRFTRGRRQRPGRHQHRSEIPKSRSAN